MIRKKNIKKKNIKKKEVKIGNYVEEAIEHINAAYVAGAVEWDIVGKMPHHINMMKQIFEGLSFITLEQKTTYKYEVRFKKKT